jgi:AcrR family transcriptional regulator
MRVTAETKRATRQRILEAAGARFAEVGFEAATTREIAATAEIATGTLFNYYPSKEAIAVTLVAEALAKARLQFEERPRGMSLEEDLFGLIVAEMRGLKPHRKYLRPVLETALSPLVHADVNPDGEAIRVDHLEAVGRLIAARSPHAPLSPVTVSLYWTLYTGVLAFWASDSSPRQEDTLAVLDHYLKAFVGSLPPPE